MTGRLAGKVALITGAGHGQGAAAARLFAAEGGSVAVVDLDGARASDVAASIGSDGGRAVAFETDVSDEEQVRATIEGAAEQLGGLQVLYNNAGVMHPGPIDTFDVETWNRQWSVNVTGPFLCAKHAIPYLRKEGGVIVNTASTAGLVGEQGNATYCATKGAIVNFTRALALDLARDGIRVNCICPGWVDTGFNDAFIAELGGDDVVTAALDAYVPMNRQGMAEEIAEVALFLASDASSLMTGAIVPVDGGLTAM